MSCACTHGGSTDRCFASSSWLSSRSPSPPMRLAPASPDVHGASLRLAPQEDTLRGPKEAAPPVESSAGPSPSAGLRRPRQLTPESSAGPSPSAGLRRPRQLTPVGAGPLQRLTPFGAATAALVVLTVATR